MSYGVNADTKRVSRSITIGYLEGDAKIKFDDLIITAKIYCGRSAITCHVDYTSLSNLTIACAVERNGPEATKTCKSITHSDDGDRNECSAHVLRRHNLLRIDVEDREETARSYCPLDVLSLTIGSVGCGCESTTGSSTTSTIIRGEVIRLSTRECHLCITKNA